MPNSKQCSGGNQGHSTTIAEDKQSSVIWGGALWNTTGQLIWCSRGVINVYMAHLYVWQGQDTTFKINTRPCRFLFLHWTSLLNISFAACSCIVSDSARNVQALRRVKRREASVINDSFESHTSSSVCWHVQLRVGEANTLQSEERTGSKSVQLFATASTTVVVENHLSWTAQWNHHSRGSGKCQSDKKEKKKRDDIWILRVDFWLSRVSPANCAAHIWLEYTFGGSTVLPV